MWRYVEDARERSIALLGASVLCELKRGVDPAVWGVNRAVLCGEPGFMLGIQRMDLRRVEKTRDIRELSAALIRT